MLNRWQTSVYGVVGIAIGAALSHWDQYHFGDSVHVLQSLHSAWSHLWPAAIGARCAAVPITIYQIRRDHRVSLNTEVNAQSRVPHSSRSLR